MTSFPTRVEDEIKGGKGPKISHVINSNNDKIIIIIIVIQILYLEPRVKDSRKGEMGREELR